MLSKGFIETIEKLWKEKDDNIESLKDSLCRKDSQIRMLSRAILNNENFKCIHDEGEYQRGHRYCDDKCPLYKISRITFKENNEIVMIPLNTMCDKPKNWSK